MEKVMEGENKQVSDTPTKTVLVALLAGAVAGSVAALLLAPQSGRASREQLRGYARRTSETLQDLAGRATHTWGMVTGKTREFRGKPQLKDTCKAVPKVMRPETEQSIEAKAS